MQPVPVPGPAPGVPVLDIDPFSDAFLANPYDFHERLREAGPVVFLSAYGIHATARHAEAQEVLRDWQTYCSGRGVGLADFSKEKPWRPASIILEADPPLHDRTRTVLARILSPGTVRDLRDTFQAEAETLADRLVAQGRFDGVTDLAEVFPLKVFPDALGLPTEGRENLLPYASIGFNAFGPRNRHYQEAVDNAGDAIGWVLSKCRREALSSDGLGIRIFQAADRGEITEDEAGLLMRSFLSAGVDTTINGLGNALYCLANHPDQWALLRQDPSRARAAFEEALRYESTVQTFFRTTTRDVELAGTPIPEGSKVLLFLAAANRDPRQWTDADRFDITRRASGHVGFGFGIHACVGQMLARLEGEAVLTALATRIGRLVPDGPEVRRLNNTLRALAHLPLRVDATA